MYTERILYEALRSIDSSTFTGSYQNLGTAITNRPYIWKIVNNSDVNVTVSFDGSTDHDFVPAGSFVLYDDGKTGLSGGFPGLDSGTQVSVKGSAGSGSVYLIIRYVKER